MDSNTSHTSAVLSVRFFSAWLVSWAFITYASALLRTELSDTTAPMSALRAWFSTADAIPPLAKLALGFSLAALYLSTERIAVSQSVQIIGVCIGTALVFACATFVYPTDYYPNYTTEEFFPWHLSVAVLGGIIFVLLVRSPHGKPHIDVNQ